MSARTSAAMDRALAAVQAGMSPLQAAAEFGVSIRQLQRRRAAAGLPQSPIGRPLKSGKLPTDG